MRRYRRPPRESCFKHHCPGDLSPARERSGRRHGAGPKCGKIRAVTSAAADRTVGGRYEITGDLGTGGHGSVHRAVDLTNRSTVALKLLGVPRDSAIASRFRREAKAAQAIDHPGCVRVLDSGEDKEAR